MSRATKPNPNPVQAPQQVERTQDFRDYYANSIFYESTAWDMKLTLGHIDQATGPRLVVKNDCSVTIPWPHAKLAIFWLRMHVELAEAEVNNKIPIRKDLIPPELPERLSEQLEANPASAKQFREVYNRIRAEFLATL